MGIYSPPVWFNAGGKKNNHNWHWHFDGKQMTVFDGGRLRCSLQPPLAGSANRDNITAALAAASFAGVDISCASELLKDYRTPMRRMQTIYDEYDILMLDDFAHHPGAYKATIAALRTSNIRTSEFLQLWKRHPICYRRCISRRRYFGTYRAWANGLLCEADGCDSAFFDKCPKNLHYRPRCCDY